MKRILTGVGILCLGLFAGACGAPAATPTLTLAPTLTPTQPTAPSNTPTTAPTTTVAPTSTPTSVPPTDAPTPTPTATAVATTLPPSPTATSSPGASPTATTAASTPPASTPSPTQVTPGGTQQVSLVASKDNTLYEDAQGDRGNSKGVHLFVGVTGQRSIRRALVAFDVPGTVPAGSTVESVELKMTMTRAAPGGGSTAPMTASLHRVLADWGEGTSDASGNEGSGAAATSGDATWVHRFYDTQQWQQQGGDFAATASAVATVGGTGGYTWGSTDQMVADVRAWLDDPSSNFGWIVVGVEGSTANAKRFSSRENATAAARPTLTITYRPSGG